MGILGFIFGLTGLSYAITAKNDLNKLKQDFEEFKASLKTSNTLNKN